MHGRREPRFEAAAARVKGFIRGKVAGLCNRREDIELSIRGHLWPEAEPRDLEPVRRLLAANGGQSRPRSTLWEIVRRAERLALGTPVAARAQNALAAVRRRQQQQQQQQRQESAGSSPRDRAAHRQKALDVVSLIFNLNWIDQSRVRVFSSQEKKASGDGGDPLPPLGRAHERSLAPYSGV